MQKIPYIPIYLIIFILLTIPTLQFDDDLLNITKFQQFADVADSYQYDIYAGYLNITYLDKALYYMFYKSQSGKDTDPIVLWLGGQGNCSAVMTAFTQNGPFIFNPQTNKVVLNKYSWNMNAHMLYIDSPAGVGFSKGKKQSLIANDSTTAQDNYAALLKFFQKFQQLKSKDFYLAGQNYAGIHIPRLATQIITNNQQQSAQDRKINLKGVLIGNGCTHPTQCYSARYVSRYQTEFLYTRGFIDGATYSEYQSTCIASGNQRTTNCQKIQQKIETSFSNSKANIYNVYGVCYPLPASIKSNSNQQHQHNKNVQQNNQQQLQIIKPIKCTDMIGLNSLFTRQQNRQSLHVQSNETLKWVPCSQSITYTVQSRATYTYLPSLISYGLQVYYYSGDFDGMVPIQGTLYWLKKFRSDYGASVKKSWRPWTFDKKVYSGMLWQLDGIVFWSIAGSGGMAAIDRPEQVKVVLDVFLGQRSIDSVQLSVLGDQYKQF